jgi:hypothetical protein
VARDHYTNHNVLHRWLREVPEPAAFVSPHATQKSVPAFIESPNTDGLGLPIPSTTSISLGRCVRGELALDLAQDHPKMVRWRLSTARSRLNCMAWPPVPRRVLPSCA